jgi:glyoxylate reductase
MKQRKKVILTHPLPSEWIAPLSENYEVIVGEENSMGFASYLEPHLEEAEGIVSFLCDKVDERIINKAEKLKVLCNYAAGTDNIDVNLCTEKKIPIGSTPGVLTNATADLTMALLLSVARNLLPSINAASSGDWKMWYPDRWLGPELANATLGIIGMGKIGSAVAKRSRSFGMNIVYVSRSAKLEIENEFQAKKVSLHELLETSDFISLHAPLTPETHHIIDQAAFRRMKPGSILVNTSRGSEVDTGALYEALSEGRIRGAGLDVTDPEPLPHNHPLYTLSNCVILPHIGSATDQTRRKMAEMTCENLIAGLSDQKLPYCANPEIYSY